MGLPCYSSVSHRYAIAVLCFWGYLIVVGYRTSFALVVTHIAKFNESTTKGDGGSIFPHCTTFNTSRDRQVDWSGSTTFLFHTAFFVGQFVGSLPGAMLSSRFSPKMILGLSVLTTSVLFLILPKATEGPEELIYIIRGLQGSAEAISVPGLNAVVSLVAGKTDRARLINIAYAGAYLSPAIAMFATGATSCYVSWDSIIYIYGSLGTFWALSWLFVVDNNLKHQTGITEDTHLLQAQQDALPVADMTRPVPWAKIFTSMPVIAIWVANFCRNLIFAVLITEVQQYYKDVYALSTATIGLLAAVPHVFMALFMIPGSLIFDHLARKSFLSITTIRKMAQCTGYGIQGVCTLCVGFTDDHVVAVVLLCFGVAFSAFAISGFQTNPLDIAPQYVGVITGIAGTGMVGSVFSTVLASQLTGDSHSLIDWQYLFFITGSIHIAGVIFYLVFASGKLQPWAMADPNKDVTGSTKKSNDEKIERASETGNKTE